MKESVATSRPREPNVRVTACIVTFNRADLLRRLLNALLQQSYPISQIIVIDNASTDHTQKVICDQINAVPMPIEHVRLEENCGGAGGFAKAIAMVMTRGPRPDYLWLMDDDGYPDVRCLEQLVRAAGQANYAAFNPIVWAEGTRPSDMNLAFPDHASRLGDIRRALSSSAEVACVAGIAGFFNGSLLEAEMVKECGTPIADFFIWGDEVEYMKRMKAMGYSFATVVTADYFHPRSSQAAARYKIGPCRWVVPSVSKERRYFLVRNYAYIAYRYHGLLGWLKHTVKWTVFGRLNPVTVWKWAFEGAEMTRRNLRTMPWKD